MLGFDFNGKTIRFFHGWLKYSNGLFGNRLKDEGVDGRTAQPFQGMRAWFDPARRQHGMRSVIILMVVIFLVAGISSYYTLGLFDTVVILIAIGFILYTLYTTARATSDDPFSWLTLEDVENDGSYLIRVNQKYAPIIDTGEVPEGLLFLVDYQAATGVEFDTVGNPDHPEGKPPRLEREPKLKVKLNGQIGVTRDPALVNYKTNPDVYGVSADVSLSAELLRTRVRIWKTIAMCAIVGVIAYLVGLAMR